ncbi:MAG TPA: class I SAM-dependent methyltransferase [Planctomycetota bacterium]|nr:class I SAM-dependent methyltransferase [Planctomycetota bacterium]
MTATTAPARLAQRSESAARRLLRDGHAYGEIFALLSAVQPKGLCLDLPSGAGVNTAGLLAAGFRPVAADLFPPPASGPAPTPAVKADWYARLPFADDTFAAVLCSEGIEHHSAQTEFLRELARVLRPGGTLLLTTPNLLSLGARLSTLLNGHHAHNRSALTEVTQVWREGEGRMPYVGHAHMVNYFALRFMLWRVGLRIESVATARWARNALLLAPLLWLPVSVATRRLLREVRDSHPEVYAEILAHVLSPSLMLGKKLIVLARKEGPPRF